MTAPLICPYCGDGPKNIYDRGCCGESSAHYVEREVSLEVMKDHAPEMYRQIKRLIVAMTGPGPSLFSQTMEARRLIKKIESKK